MTDKMPDEVFICRERIEPHGHWLAADQKLGNDEKYHSDAKYKALLTAIDSKEQILMDTEDKVKELRACVRELAASIDYTRSTNRQSETMQKWKPLIESCDE